MQIKGVIFSYLFTHLTNRFQKWQALDIADCAADFGNHHIGIVFAADIINPFLDLIGDVRDDLHGTAEIVAFAFFVDDRPVNLACGHIGTLGQVDIDKPLVVTEIEVGFAAVIRYKNLAVLIRTHRAWVDINVGIEFLNRDLHAPAFQQAPQGSCRYPLAQRRNHPASDKNVFWHMRPPPLLCVTHAVPVHHCPPGTRCQSHRAVVLPAAWSGGSPPLLPTLQTSYHRCDRWSWSPEPIRSGPTSLFL